MNTETKKLNPKKKGPIRFEAIIPISLILGGTFLYTSYYFDKHLKSLVEYVGTQANGAEVNVENIKTSFLKGSFKLSNLEVTNKESPKLNSLQIGEIHFQFMWDALLRMKFVVDDASISSIQIQSPRKSPGKVLPPEPAKPSKINEIQDQVLAQVKNKYSENMLGDLVKILDGGDFSNQVDEIRETLKSEARINEIIADVKSKKQSWDIKIKNLSNLDAIKNIERQINTISKEKNFLKQLNQGKVVADDFKKIEKQFKEVKETSKQLETEIKLMSQYPNEVKNLVESDINALKNRFSIPQLDFKDMAMGLFGAQFAGHIVTARKYHAIAKQYIPEKKKEEVIIPPPRSEGKSYRFPITTSYPLFWLKRAAISSKGTKDSYSGDLSGELTNVTTDPKFIKKPAVLELKGNFPASEMYGVRTTVTIDHTETTPKQKAVIEVAQFKVPEKTFIKNNDINFGFSKANGSTTIQANYSEGNVAINWNSTLKDPEFNVESKSRIAKEMLSNILKGIPFISINGSATGTFENLNLSLQSNLGTELSQGFSREIGAKIAEAQKKLNDLVESKIKNPQAELSKLLGDNAQYLTSLNGAQNYYQKNKDRIEKDIKKLLSGNSKKEVDKIKEQGKKLLKGIKF